MFRSHLFSLIVVGLVAGAASAADDAYTLKLYKSKAGDKSDNEKFEVSKTNVVAAIMGMENKQEIEGGKKEIYTEEILEKKAGDKRATKLTRTYSTAEKTEKGETKKSVYAGKTVLIEKKGEKYTFSIDGEKLTQEEAPGLYKSFNKSDDEPQNEDLLPKEAVKVGGSWKVPAEMSEKMFKTLGDEKMKIDVKKSSVGGKLLKVYKKEGTQFGTIELTIEILVTEIDLGGKFAETKAGSKVVLKGTIDTCIDGTVNFEDSKMVAVIDITADLPNNVSLMLSGTSTGVEKSRVSKK